MANHASGETIVELGGLDCPDLDRQVGRVYRFLLNLADTVAPRAIELTDGPRPGTDLEGTLLTGADVDTVCANSTGEEAC